MAQYPNERSRGERYRDERHRDESTGSAAERAAERWLRGRGLRLVARNYRCRRGEIDLIMSDGTTLVFVEVRMRTRADFGDAAASVTATKQRRLSAAAGHYLAHHPRAADRPCRFDVVAVSSEPRHRFEWIRNAFTAWE